MLHVHPVEKRVTVKCLVRHPALLSPPLMNFVKIGPDCEYKLTRTLLLFSIGLNFREADRIQRISFPIFTTEQKRNNIELKLVYLKSLLHTA